MAKQYRKFIFGGGCKPTAPKALLKNGEFSMVQNLRNTNPGFKKRAGQAKLHTTADGTNRCMSLYQYAKGKKDETHFYAQMSDSDVLEATNDPPTVTTGAFGSEVFSGTASPWPASWANVDDFLFFSNGVDPTQIFTGTARDIDKFVVFRGTAAPDVIPTRGEDFSDEIRGVKSGNAILDSLGDLAVDYDCIFICVPVPCDTLTWTVSATNGTASVMQAKYKKSDDTWATVSGFTDNTISSSCTLGQSGTMTWTLPTDWIPTYMYGYVGYWMQLSLSSGDLDSEVEVSGLTFETDWQNMENIWDGVLVEAIEAHVYENGSDFYLRYPNTLEVYGSTSIDMGGFDANDELYISTYDTPNMMYVEVGETPNSASVTLTMKYWDGDSWESMTISDGTNGCKNSGWITFARPTGSKTQNFNKTQYYAHWFQITSDATMSSSTAIGVYFAPYFDITEIGNGLANCAWKGRMVYSTDRDHYLYVSTLHAPQVLNGIDYGMLEPGDGRPHLPVAMRRFKNELMVWQQEKGEIGGCLTLFEGYTPATFGKLILSTKWGTMNNNTVDIVEGVLTSTRTDETIKDLVYCLSRYGVYVTDGVYCSVISHDVRKHFDPTDTTNCIRYGYEKLMWLKHDATYNVIRIGLVTGSSATTPNTFLVYDITHRSWSYDDLAQPLACMAEIEAGSGNVPILQVGGGTADGTVYLLNSGTNDVSTAIDAYATAEFGEVGDIFNVSDLILRCKAQTGNITVTPYSNDISGTAKTLDMSAEVTNQVIRRHRENMNTTGHQVSIKFRNATASQGMDLYDYQIGLEIYEGQ